MKILLLAAILLLQTVTSQQTLKVSGRLIREDPHATGQDSVRLSGGRNGGALFTPVGADGSFQFSNVPAGEYLIVVGPVMTMTPVLVVVADKDVSGLELKVPAIAAAGAGLGAALGGTRGRGGNNTNNQNANNANNSNRGGNSGAPLGTANINDLLNNLAGGASGPEAIQALRDVLDGRGGARGNAPGAQTLKQIAVFDRQGQLLSRVADPIPASMVSMSSNGERVAYAQSDGAIMAVDLASKTGVRITSQGRGAPAWSPDGRRIAYMAICAGVSGLCVKSSNGTGVDELLLASANGLFQWSPDGRFIVTGLGGNFVALPTGGDRKPNVIFSASGKTGPRLSPDSRFLAYTSTESGSNQVWIRTFDPTGAAESSAGITQWRISADGALGMVRWRNDGKELYYLASDGRVMAVPITTAPQFKAGTPALLFQVPADFPLQPNAADQLADVSADGQRFVFLSPVPGVPAPAMNTNNNSRGGRGLNSNTSNSNIQNLNRGNTTNSPGTNNANPNSAVTVPATVGQSGVIAGRITQPDGAPAIRVRVGASAVREAGNIVTGTWLAMGVINEPWTLELNVNGTRLTGTVNQNLANNTVPIDDGSVKGDAFSFKVRSTTGNRLITFTGTVKGDEMTLNRAVEILPGGVAGGQGIYGSDGARVFTARRDSKVFEIFSETDNAGHYRLDRLPPGRYRITAGTPEAPTYFPGAASAGEATIVIVGPSETVESRDFRLAK